VWNAGTQSLSSDGTANNNGDAGNFTVMNFADPSGFTSIQFNWAVEGSGVVGIGELSAIQAVPLPSALYSLGSGIIGFICIFKRRKAEKI
jgi:hypothetical protein